MRVGSAGHRDGGGPRGEQKLPSSRTHWSTHLFMTISKTAKDSFGSLKFLIPNLVLRIIGQPYRV
jgi:hypothetical protein